MLTFTLDTGIVLAGVRHEPEAPYVDRLIELERAGNIGIAVTVGFDADQVRARRARRSEGASSERTVRPPPETCPIISSCRFDPRRNHV